jgi:hypothetical protein
MKLRFFVPVLLIIAGAIVVSRADALNPPQDNTMQQDNTTQSAKKHITITGCLTSVHRGAYQLTAEDGVTYLVYGKSVQLSDYVGKSVTLEGDKSATPSTDTGTGRPKPHFHAISAQPESGTCK